MGGFLSGLSRLVVPVGEVGGSALAQEGMLTDVQRRRAAQQKALTDLTSGLGPEYAGLGPALAAGVDPNTAIGLIQSVAQKNKQSAVLKDFQTAGKWSPDLAVRAVDAGLIPASSLGKLLTGGVAPDGPAAVQMLQGMIDGETDPTRKAQLQAMIPAAMENGTIVFRRFESLKNEAQGKPPSISWRTTHDLEGNEIQVPYRYDSATNSEVPVDIAGGGLPGKLSQNRQKQLDSVNDVQAQIPRLRGIVGELSDATPGSLAKEYAKYRAPFGIAGPVDPRYGEYFNALGQIQTDLVQAAMGSSRAYQLVQDLKPHIPTPLDPPQRALEKLNGFDMGRFAAIKQTILGGTALPSSDPSAPPPIPPFPYSEIRVGADGSYLVKDKNGAIWGYDTSAGTWLPTH